MKYSYSFTCKVISICHLYISDLSLPSLLYSNGFEGYIFN